MKKQRGAKQRGTGREGDIILKGKTKEKKREEKHNGKLKCRKERRGREKEEHRESCPYACAFYGFFCVLARGW